MLCTELPQINLESLYECNTKDTTFNMNTLVPSQMWSLHWIQGCHHLPLPGATRHPWPIHLLTYSAMAGPSSMLSGVPTPQLLTVSSAALSSIENLGIQRRWPFREESIRRRRLGLLFTWLPGLWCSQRRSSSILPLQAEVRHPTITDPLPGTREGDTFVMLRCSCFDSLIGL